MPFERVETRDALQFYGNVFVPELMSETPVFVDGDLVTATLIAPEVTVRNGSLLCPDLRCPIVRADILGVFDLLGQSVMPPGWTYTYLRPCVALPLESAWDSETSIANGAWLFLRPEIVVHPDLVKPFIDRALRRKQCGRARVLFRIALEELLEHPEALTPFGRQVVECFRPQDCSASPDVPSYWRF